MIRLTVIAFGIAVLFCAALAVAVRATETPLPPIRQHLECSDYYGNGYTVVIHRYRTDRKGR